MYAGILAVCKENDATPFYFSAQDNRVMYLNTFEKVKIKDLTDVKTFFVLNSNGLVIKKQDKK